LAHAALSFVNNFKETFLSDGFLVNILEQLPDASALINTNNNKKFLKMSQPKLKFKFGKLRAIGIDEILHTDLNNLDSFEKLILFYEQANYKASNPIGMLSDKEVTLQQR
jgi:hypothetical protein